MDLEEFLFALVSEIEKADKDGVDVVKFVFHNDQIHEIAEAFRKPNILRW